MKNSYLEKRFQANIRRLVLQNYRSLVFKWGIPIYLGFGALDYLIGSQWEQRLLIRIFGAVYLGIFILPIGQRFIKKYYSIFPAMMDIGLNATLVLMVILGEGIRSQYFVGMILISLAFINFMPMSSRVGFFGPIGTAFVYLVSMILFKDGLSEPKILFENFAFLFGAGILDGLSAGNNYSKIRALDEKNQELHLQNLRREDLIKKKSKEISRQQLLTTQFSPQICKMVYNGEISLEQPLKRANITICVIDIVNSTSTMAELDPRKSRIVIETFFDVVTKCFLHWDLTIDKFTGDGVMALANAPRAQEDHSMRCVKACFEVMRSIDEQRNQVEALWGGPFDVRFGIHRGDATVGFIGSSQIRSYTAIGKSVSLAHRLCDKAPINTILITEETFSEVIYYDPSIEAEMGPLQSYKGFEKTKFNTRVIHAPHIGAGSDIDSICEHCEGPLYVESLPNGTMGLMCRNCDTADTSVEKVAHPRAA